MQIIIVQSEIELAVKAYVLSQLNVKDGHRIDVSFAATRGEDGLKATIDIVSPEVPAGKQTAEVEPAAAVAEVHTSPRKARLSSPLRAAPAVEPENADEPEKVVKAEPTPEKEPADQGGNEEKPDGGQEEQEEEPAPATSGRSLFSNLRKPTNS